MTRKRRLRPDEQSLWDRVARTAEPLSPKRPFDQTVRTKPEAQVEPAPHFKPSPFSIGEVTSKSTSNDVLPGLSDRLSDAPVQMDQKAFRRMTRGKTAPEARIDLHGMTLAEAHPALIDFISNAASRGLRLVLVITGKGKSRDSGGPIPTRFGVLRHQVPQWLAMPPLRPLILEVREAHQRHGGGGAYYVYLRRRR